MDQAERLQTLRDDIDIRMLDLFEHFEAFDDDTTREIAIAIARAAYARGYADAAFIADPGAFYRKHGYAPPLGTVS